MASRFRKKISNGQFWTVQFINNQKGSSEKNIVRKNRFTIQSGALRNCYVLLRNSDLMARSYD